jgi:hypothetical protein
LESEIKYDNHSPLKVEPGNIYFGSLKPNTGKNAVLKVTGGPGDVLVYNDRFKVTPSSFGKEDTEIQVALIAGSAGELIWDNIVFRGQSTEITVLVTALWEGFAPETDIIKPEPFPPIGGTQIPTSERPWKGRRCLHCNKNIAYDTNVHEWKQCTCNWYQKVINRSLRVIKGFFRY